MISAEFIVLNLAEIRIGGKDTITQKNALKEDVKTDRRLKKDCANFAAGILRRADLIKFIVPCLAKRNLIAESQDWSVKKLSPG